MSAAETRSATVRRTLPPALRGYQRSWLRADILAGVTLAAVAIPESMGYSTIAHVPVVSGLYTIILPTVVFAVIGSSRLMVVGADSATAAILGSGIAGIGVAGLQPDSAEWLGFASLIAIVTGVMLAVARLARLGFLGDFLSTAVLVGFLAGTGISVLTGQIPGMLGISGSDGRIWERWEHVLQELGSIRWAAVAFAVATLLLLAVGRRWLTRIPMPIVVVVASIVVVYAFGWSDDVPVIGTLHGGWPQFGLPDGVSWVDIPKAATVAIGCAVVILAQSAATSRSFAQRHGEEANVNRDIVGLSAANIVAGFSSTFVVNGSPTKTQLVEEEHGRTQVANVTMAVVALIVVVFFDDALGYLPHAVLSAIVAVVAVRLIDVWQFRRMWRVRRYEFTIAILTAVVVLVFGVQTGVITAMGASLLAMVRRQYRPERFVVGVSDHGRHRRYESATPGAESMPGLIVFRYDADLFYANASRFADEVMALVKAAPHPVRWMVLDCTVISDVDYTASTMLKDLITFVHKRNAHFVLAGVDPELGDDLLTEGVLAGLNPDHVFATVGAAVRAYEADYPDAVEAARREDSTSAKTPAEGDDSGGTAGSGRAPSGAADGGGAS
ncbi:SulP family inorganic anion transporter [Gordonia aichiensis]|uniref:Putative sulfate transporter n=1 Tax=Gordonia aichiensis NBRC 108223 TaxID=1220583 RepID=L7KNH9_9ACTN|nr:SulP family inorganic anion transporter [Gordonia aichiensis]GAC49268.1 putative sulfate transporter [Gordonia aichiensis NBRC 108223]